MTRAKINIYKSKENKTPLANVYTNSSGYPKNLMPMFEEVFEEAFLNLAETTTLYTINQFNKFCSILINWNGKINIGELGCCESIGNVNEDLGMMKYRLFNSKVRNCDSCGKVKLLTKIHMNQLAE